MAISCTCVNARKISAVGSPTYYGQWPTISGPDSLAKIAFHCPSRPRRKHDIPVPPLRSGEKAQQSRCSGAEFFQFIAEKIRVAVYALTAIERRRQNGFL
jgi:hypothetical protein